MKYLNWNHLTYRLTLEPNQAVLLAVNTQFVDFTKEFEALMIACCNDPEVVGFKV